MFIRIFVAVSASLVSAQTIVPELERHTAEFEKKIYRVTDRVYSAVGYSLGNSILIEGDTGVIIVDTLSSFQAAQQALADFRKITQKPVAAVIYTHFHPDHTQGVKAFASAEDAASGKVAIWAHESLLANFATQGGLIAPILGVRSSYTFGAGITAAERQGMNAGIGPLAAPGRSTFIAPTKTYRGTLDVAIAGVKLRLIHSPSEAPDETAVYLPDSNVLLSAEVIQGPTFPNIHTLRGTAYRDPVLWYESIDRLRALHAEYLVPSHGAPATGAQKVEEILRMYRDGIQFVHDQTLRYMNKGLTPDELVAVVKLPPHLESYAPYLRQYYGTVEHSVREIYFGYLGWFAGDPVALHPIAPVESAKRHIALMGGHDRVLEEARKAAASGDAQWAAELTTYLVRANHEDQEARAMKAAAFRTLGYAQMNINWRNWYLASAHELDGSLDVNGVTQRARANFGAPDVIAALPARIWVTGHAARLKAEQTLDVHTTLAIDFTDTKESFGIEIRRGVAQVYESAPPSADLKMVLDKKTLDGILLGQTILSRAIESGSVKVTQGSAAQIAAFFGYFETAFADPIALTVR